MFIKISNLLINVESIKLINLDNNTIYFNNQSELILFSNKLRDFLEELARREGYFIASGNGDD